MKINFIMDQDINAIQQQDDVPPFMMINPFNISPIPELLPALQLNTQEPVSESNIMNPGDISSLSLDEQFLLNSNDINNSSEKTAHHIEYINKIIISEPVEVTKFGKEITDIGERKIQPESINPDLLIKDNSLKLANNHSPQNINYETPIVGVEKVHFSEYFPGEVKNSSLEVAPENDHVSLKEQQKEITLDSYQKSSSFQSVEEDYRDAKITPKSFPDLRENIASLFNEKLSSDTLHIQNQPIRTKLMEIKQEYIQTPAGLKIDTYLAKIKVHPENAGEITARIEVAQGKASIELLTENHQVKQFLEMNIQHLQESFQKANLDLMQVMIDSHSKKNNPEQERDKQEEEQNSMFKKQPGLAKHSLPRVATSIIDTYA